MNKQTIKSKKELLLNILKLQCEIQGLPRTLEAAGIQEKKEDWRDTPVARGPGGRFASTKGGGETTSSLSADEISQEDVEKALKQGLKAANKVLDSLDELAKDDLPAPSTATKKAMQEALDTPEAKKKSWMKRKPIPKPQKPLKILRNPSKKVIARKR